MYILISVVHFLLFLTYLIFEVFFRPVYAIPLINKTNPYYERHLEHINSI